MLAPEWAGAWSSSPPQAVSAGRALYALSNAPDEFFRTATYFLQALNQCLKVFILLRVEAFVDRDGNVVELAHVGAEHFETGMDLADTKVTTNAP